MSKSRALAEKLDAQATWVPSGPAGVMYQSANELRRLAKVNDDLLESLLEMLELRYAIIRCEVTQKHELDILRDARAAIKKATE